MSLRLLSAMLVAALACRPSAASADELALRIGDFVAVVGDSITEQKQYSVFLEDYLLTARPAASVRVAQFGWGGETAKGFSARMDNDMLRFHPTVVTTCFGMNDGGYSPMTQEKAQGYRAKQTAIVKRCKAAGVRVIVVGSPGCVDSDKFRNSAEAATMYNKVLAEERDICREVAKEQGVLFADVYSAMFDAMTKAKAKYGRGYHVGGGDGVHPDANGQLCMAFAFLKALGCPGDIGRIDVDLTSVVAKASAGHTVKESVKLDGGVLLKLQSERYPFCFMGEGDTPAHTRSILPMLPFNAELNRLTLVVAGAAAPRYKVTWASDFPNTTHSKEFTGAELANGVNLANEFLDNPFFEYFMSVDHAVREQQNFETPLVKTMLHSLNDFKKFAPPDVTDDLEKVADKLIAHDTKLFDEAAAASIGPVKHVIMIEAIP